MQNCQTQRQTTKCNLVRLPILHIQRFGAYTIAWRGRTFDRTILHKAMRVNPKTRIEAYNKSSPKGCTASQIFSCSCPLMMSDDRRFIQMSGAQCRWGSSVKMWAEWGVKLGGSRRHIQLHLMSVPSQKKWNPKAEVHVNSAGTLGLLCV